MKKEQSESRRQFIQKSEGLGAGVLLAGPGGQRLFAQGNQPPDPMKGSYQKLALPRSGGHVLGECVSWEAGT